MLLPLLFFAIGLVLLVAGADALVSGASRIAQKFNIPPLIVGLTIVSIGTSAPEIVVSTTAALTGTTALALGNVVGSNIFNVLLIMGITALILPLVVSVSIIRQEVPVMIGFSILFQCYLAVLTLPVRAQYLPVHSHRLRRNNSCWLNVLAIVTVTGFECASPFVLADSGYSMPSLLIGCLHNHEYSS